MKAAGIYRPLFYQGQSRAFAREFDILSIEEFEEGALPRKLIRLTLRKKEA